MPSKQSTDPKAACSTAPLFAIRSSSRCAPCLLAEEEEASAENLAVDRGRAAQDEAVDLAQIMIEQGTHLYHLARRYPKTPELKEVICQGRRCEGLNLQGSGLKFELLSLEAGGEESARSDEDAASAAYYDEWANPWAGYEPSASAISDVEDDIRETDLVNAGWNPMGLEGTLTYSWPGKDDMACASDQRHGDETAPEPDTTMQPSRLRARIIEMHHDGGQKENAEPGSSERSEAPELHGHAHKSFSFHVKATSQADGLNSSAMSSGECGLLSGFRVREECSVAGAELSM